jgi:hypothetical protein
MTRFVPPVVALVLAAPAPAFAQAGNPLPVPNESGQRAISNPDIYRREGVWKKKAEANDEKRRQAEEDLARLKAQLEGKAPSVAPSAVASGARPAGSPAPAAPPGLTVAPLATRGACPPAAPPARRKRASRARHAQPAAATATATPATITTTTVLNSASSALGTERAGMPMVFTVSASDPASGRETVVPMGSYVKARILTGVEANSHEAFPMLLQLDYAFVGPNKHAIDMSNCFVIVKAKANLSTERVLGETQQISCVRNNNEAVTRSAKGYLAGEDSTFGLTGELISNQGRVLLAAVIASLAKGAGEAVAAAQTSTQIATGGVGGTAQATNITGDKAAYVAGRALSDPASMIASWYLDYAKQLVPAIGIGSGRDVWVVLLETVKVPPLEVD